MMPRPQDRPQEFRDRCRVNECPAAELGGEINTLVERVANLERWQVAQNGTLIRLEDRLEANGIRYDEKLDKLILLLVSSLITAILALGCAIITLLTKH